MGRTGREQGTPFLKRDKGKGVRCSRYISGGRAMRNPFAMAQKYLDASKPEMPTPEVVEDKTILGVKICSRILEDEIWLILDRSFTPSDGLAVYYAEEIPLLRDKT